MYAAEKRCTDLLSNLPEDVRLNILERLPLQDAIKTGILSSHWRRKWAKLPHIILDEEFFSTVVKERGEGYNVSKTYANIVNNVLLCHIGPLNKFVLYIPLSFDNDTNVHEWLRFVSQKNVSGLTLIDDREILHKLPSTVFFCTGLTRLTLRACTIPTLPPAFTGFPFLIGLEFLKCELKSAEFLESLISSCPQLRILRCRNLYPLNNVTVHAPKLETLLLVGCFSKICLGDKTTNIRMLILDFSSDGDLSLVFSSLPVIQSLHLGPNFCKFLWRFCKQGWVSNLLQLNTKTLGLSGIQFYDPTFTCYALKLLNLSRTLQRLCCKVSEPKWKSPDELTHLSHILSTFENINFWSLEYMEIVDVWGSSIELLFIKGILKRAPVLKVMTITLSKTVKEDKDKLKIATRLMLFSRASRYAQIIFKN